MNVLAIGAHPDDIELGCGAALVRHRAMGDSVTLLVMTTGEHGPQDARSRVAEQQDAAEMLNADLVWGSFTDGEVPDGRPAVDLIQSVLKDCAAEVVYTHTTQDTHQDHRATAVASLAATRRSRRVLQYESPTSQNFRPQVFIDVGGFVEAKVNLLRAHVSQVLKNGLVDLEAIEAAARYRGFQARVREAEAFEIERFLWDVHSSPAPTVDIDLTLEAAMT